jgi:putative membrane-bound dehydrogenase-like protein
VLFTGFATTGSTQLRVSHPTLSPDNWIYVANGLSGGTITSPKNPQLPAVELKKHTFRFRPDFSVAEVAGGPAQFGLTFDDFNRMFVCYNRVHVQHVLFSPQELARAAYLPNYDMLHNCPEEMSAEPLKGHGTAAKLFPISKNITTADSHAGTFTAACGVTIARDSTLPPDYQTGVFACDPTANLVHYDQLLTQGCTFTARRVHENAEFLRSIDTWFRPVNLAYGPDGGLYICDMYRKTIEHPDYLPAEIRKHTDFESGRTMGRIWRVIREDHSADIARQQRKVSLQDASLETLVAALKENAWHRDTAQRLLVERNDVDCREMLMQQMRKFTSPAADIRALYVAHYLRKFAREELLIVHIFDWSKLNSLKEKELLEELSKHKIAKNLFGENVNSISDFAPSLQLGLCRIVITDSPENERWLFQQLKTLPYQLHPADSLRGLTLSGYAWRTQHDAILRKAFWIAAGKVSDEEIIEMIKSKEQDQTFNRDFLIEYGATLAVLDKEVSALKVFAKVRPELSTLHAAELLLGIARLGKNLHRDDLQNCIHELQVQLDKDEASPRGTQAIVELLGYTSFDKAGERLLLAASSSDGDLQRSALQSLGKLNDTRVASALLEESRWSKFSPVMREEALTAICQQTVGIETLLKKIEAGELPANVVDPFRRRQFMAHKHPTIRELSTKLFGQVSGDRATVYEEFKGVAEEPGNAANGKIVFQKTCASCHRLDREGFAVGPDLFSIRNQPKAAILLHILAPDHEITPGFTAYQVVLHDGRSFTGLLAAESATSITLRLPQGKEEQFPRDAIEELVPSKLSLMPQGLEKTITRPEFADLLAYLKGEAIAPERAVPANTQ